MTLKNGAKVLGVALISLAVVETDAAIRGQDDGRNRGPALPSASVTPEPPAGSFPMLPAHWLPDNAAIRSGYRNLLDDLVTDDDARVGPGVASLRAAIARVGGHPNLQGALAQIGPANASANGTAPSTFDPDQAAAYTLQNAALQDGVDFANATADIMPGDFAPGGKPLDDSFEATAATQSNRGDCVTVALFQGLGNIEPGRRLLNDSVRSVGNDTSKVRLQGLGPNAIYSVSKPDLANPRNHWIKGSKALLVIGAAMNTALSANGGSGIGDGSTAGTIGGVLVGAAAGHQAITGQGKVPSELAALLYELIPGMKNDTVVLLTGSPDDKGRWVAVQQPDHQFGIPDGDRATRTLLVRNPWFDKKDAQNLTIREVADAMAGSGSQIDIFNLRRGQPLIPFNPFLFGNMSAINRTDGA